MGDYDCHRDEDAVSVNSECLTSLGEHTLAIARIPDTPNDDTGKHGVEVEGEDHLEETATVNEPTCISIKISQLVRQGLLLCL